MGRAQEFREKYGDLEFYLVKQVDGIGIYKSQVIEVPVKEVDEDDIEVFIQIIVSLGDKFKTHRHMSIQEIYNTAKDRDWETK